ncbi:cytochrome P450 [Punctularia strigosozonata HHB-11173 SS5]|uniref:Cytochrome P450 n=1 Tax=Punctularia strigosozonata (strain HHB-11173) TaxID=741275 RepID=R7S478_PUNST|nr:cytochrome P450 [Punctularia strigosozonata HHB-11173 SS5]EIN04046.1 cytochrome P450 [Punctularia strigosozonata HHB-11173 SS5]
MIILLVSAGLLLFLVSRVLRFGSRRTGFPPGPPTVPILGNAHIFPKDHAFLQLSEWARTYGGVYSVMLGNGPTIVVTSAKAAFELMEKQSAVTVDRPPSHIGAEIVGTAVNLAFVPYSEDWRLMRKAANSILTPQSAAKHVPIQRAESFQLVYDLLHTPERAWWHLRRTSNSVALSILYGRRAPRYESDDLSVLFDVVDLVGELLDPGAHPPVDMFPILKYVPERWARWKTMVKRLRSMQRALYFRLLQQSEDRVTNSEASEDEPFIDKVVRRQADYGLNRERTAYLGGTLVEAGSDTSASFMQSFVLLIAAFPDAQKRLHEEMDRVVGSKRVPEYDDFDNLPYLQATIKEVHRYRPVAPLGLPHAALEDLTYDGYLIPRGSAIIVNMWGIYHNPDVYDDPEMFNPERYLKSEFGTKPDVDPSYFKHTMPFGFGRRICPGRHLVDNTIRVNTMDLVWGFTFGPPINEATGKPEPLDLWSYSEGLGTGPKPYKCTIKPRSSQHADLIRSEFESAIPLYGPYEEGLSNAEKEWLAQQRFS